MTDNDESNPSRDHPSRSDGDDDERLEEARPHGARAVDTLSSAKGAHAAPTDPEVPSAKRRGALRQQGSLIGLAAVVLGLLSITLSLLYRAGRSVGTSETVSPRFAPLAPTSTGDVDSVPLDVRERSLRAPPTAMPASQPSPDLPDHFPDDHTPAPSAAASSKIPPPASDIIRTPAF